MDWYLVSSQLYFTINLEEIFYFNNKKCRIYAAFGVSQTPFIFKEAKGYKKECQQTRVDLDWRLKQAIEEWKR